MKERKSYRTRGEVLREAFEAVGIVTSILIIFGLLLFIGGCDRVRSMADDVITDTAEAKIGG